MKIIKNNKENYNNNEELEFPMIHVCSECGSEIEIDETDLEQLDMDKETYIDYYCPVCGEWNTVEVTELHNWPKSFYHFGVTENAVPCEDKWVQRFVNDIAKFLSDSKPGDSFEAGTGDTIVIGKHYEDCKQIIVAKNYWEETYDLKD